MKTNPWSVVRQVGLLLLVVWAGRMQAAESATDTVLRADRGRLEAMRTGDGPALARVFSDDVVFVHSDGRSELKKDYIKNMTAGDTAYSDLKTYDLNVRSIAADVIVLSGAQEMRRLGAEWSEVKLRFMSVWRNEGGTWRMVAWQSMRPSGNSVVPAKK